MASVFFTVGKTRVATNASAVGGSGAVGSSQTTTRYIMTMSVDDGTAAFSASDTTLSTSGTPTNEFDQLLDAFATHSAGVSTFVCTLAGTTAYDGNVIKRIVLHDDSVANVTKTSTTIIAGVDALSITKTALVSFAITLQITYS